MTRENSIHEQALLSLCKKAWAKSPIDLVDKKIAFIFYSDGVEVKMFAKISRIVISNDKDGGGFVSLFLSSGEDDYKENSVLNCNDGKTWKYSYYDQGEEKRSFLIESMIFKLKWWQV